MGNRIKELDGLRGLAVVLVMALHIFKRASYFTEHPVLLAISNLTNVGWVGVDIFFTLSGFLITSILLKAKTEPHYFKNFYMRRVLRIFPLYYVAIALVLLFAPKVEPEFTGQLNIALPIMLIYQQNWAMLFKDFHMTQYLGITWSLAIEEQFYLLWPFVVYRLDKERLVKFSFGYIALSWLARILGTLLWPDTGQATSFFFYASFARFEEVLLGGLLAVFLTFDGAREQVRHFSIPVFGVSLAVFVALCLMSLPGIPHPDYGSIPLTLGGYTTAALFSAGLIGVFVTHPPQNILRKIFQNPILAFLGKYSYSMYLFHMTAALILLDVFWHSGMRGWKPFILYPVTTYIVTALIALLTWNLLEKHVLGLKKFFEFERSRKPIIEVNLLSILFGLASALSWGAGDFTGGLAARKVGAYRSVFYGEVIGIIVLFIAVGATGEPILNSRSAMFAVVAGALGTVGLMLLYHAMAGGLMSIAAPVSALLAATLPVTVGMFTEGLPDYLTMIGFGFALLAVWMISQSENGVKDILSHLSDLKLPLLAGIGFGFYFVLMHEATRSGGTLWPMIFSRSGGIVLITTYLLITRSPWKIDTSALPIISANGILDLGGNFFFILASQAGRLDVASVLSSLFPGATVVLAWIFLKERLNRNQWIGIAAALIAIVLMTM